MENQKIRFHTKFIKSITDFKFYENFLNQSTGKALKYLLMLTITIGVLWLIRPIYEFNTSITQMVYSFHESVPDFTLKNGELKIDKEMPIKLEDTNNVVIIDTTGKTNESVLDAYDSGVFIGKNSLVQKKSGFETRSFNFSQLEAFELTKDDVENLIPLLRGINVIILIFGLPWFFVSKLFSALILSIIGLILSSIKKVDIKFGGLYKLSIYALTLPILIKVILSAMNLTIPHFWIVYFALGSVYLWNAIPEEKATLEDGTGLS